MTNQPNTSPARYPIALTIEEMEYVHEILTSVKSAAARNGLPYPKHSARVRTELEEAVSDARARQLWGKQLGVQRKASLK